MTVEQIYRTCAESIEPDSELESKIDEMISFCSTGADIKKIEEAIQFIVNRQEQVAFKAGFRAAIRLMIDALGA